MKKLLFVAIMLLSFGVNSADCLDNKGITYTNCETVNGAAGEKPNIIIRWLAPTERADNKPLSPSEIGGFKIYFHEIATDYWTEHKAAGDTRAVNIYKPLSKYAITATAIDTGGRESVASIETIIDLISMPILAPKGINTIVIEIKLN